jgi:hypothetical protein
MLNELGPISQIYKCFSAANCLTKYPLDWPRHIFAALLVATTIGWWKKPKQGCQMVYFQTKNPYLDKFWRALEWKMLVILWPFGTLYICTVIWYNLWPFGIVCGYLVYVYFPFWYAWTTKNQNLAILQRDQSWKRERPQFHWHDVSLSRNG